LPAGKLASAGDIGMPINVVVVAVPPVTVAMTPSY